MNITNERFKSNAPRVSTPRWLIEHTEYTAALADLRLSPAKQNLAEFPH